MIWKEKVDEVKLGYEKMDERMELKMNRKKEET